jgi:hypothetical protein
MLYDDQLIVSAARPQILLGIVLLGWSELQRVLRIVSGPPSVPLQYRKTTGMRTSSTRLVKRSIVTTTYMFPSSDVCGIFQPHDGTDGKRCQPRGGMFLDKL